MQYSRKREAFAAQIVEQFRQDMFDRNRDFAPTRAGVEQGLRLAQPGGSAVKGSVDTRFGVVRQQKLGQSPFTWRRRIELLKPACRFGHFICRAACESGQRFVAAETLPSPCKRMVANQIEDDAGIAACAGGKTFAKGDDAGMAIGNSVDASMQPDRTSEGLWEIAILKAATYPITQNRAGQRQAGCVSEPEMGEIVH